MGFLFFFFFGVFSGVLWKEIIIEFGCVYIAHMDRGFFFLRSLNLFTYPVVLPQFNLVLCKC